MGPPTPVSSGQGSNTSANACLACRKIKMKCLVSQDTGKCERCTRKFLDCIFQSHRRGRKLGTRLKTAHTGRGVRSIHESGVSYGRQATAFQEAHPPTTQAISSDQDGRPETATRTRGFWTDSEGFQPPSLLNKQASSNFSLQNILSTSGSTHLREAPAAPEGDCDDPIHIGLINVAIARSLFEGFMNNLNPFISQFDPVLHTFSWTRETSAFLFTSMLSAAAKALNPALHPQLKDHAESLLSHALHHGVKSSEVVQAILVLTYWKDPEDTRAFVRVGLAVRIALELGWHKISVRSQPASQGHDERCVRNIERTWLVLFVYDRSISIQTGTPFMIQRSHFIESADDWLCSPIASTNDGLLCAFVSLRLLTSNIPELLSPQSGTQREHLHHVRPLINAIKGQIDRWQHRWSRIAVQECCHTFLTEFYGTHTLLLLFSSPLQSSLSDKKSLIDMETIWVSYSAALRMLQLVADDNNRSCLYFVQDSVHVMIAYAAVFLVKLLLSVPKSLRGEIEEPLLISLRTASSVFTQQAAPPNSGAALQSTFLTNVVAIASKTSRRASAHNHPGHCDSASLESQRANAAAQTRVFREGETTQCSPDITVESQLQDLQNLRRHQEDIDPNMDLSNTPQSQELDFFDEKIWSEMFRIAGFNINEGIFLPDASG